MLSPEQMRKKSLAQDESERHARYAQADGSMRRGNEQAYYVSPAIERAEQNVERIAVEEEELLGNERYEHIGLREPRDNILEGPNGLRRVRR